MLGRYADNLYWMARYLERSENMARRIDATLHHALTQTNDGAAEWSSVIVSNGNAALFNKKYSGHSMANVINFVLRDQANTNSVMSLLGKARQNARIVRTALTQEVWQSLNESWISYEKAIKRPINIRDLPAILESIVKGSSLFRGALYGTMLHNDIFNFVRLGTFIERADNTARIIDAKYHRLLPTASALVGGPDQSQWEVMLRSVAGWRSFNWLNKGRLDPVGVAIFLIFDKRMPRSLSFCYKEISSNLHDLEMAYGRQYDAGDTARALAQTIKDGEQNNIHLSNLHDFITSFISTNNQLSLTIAKDFNLN